MGKPALLDALVGLGLLLILSVAATGSPTEATSVEQAVDRLLGPLVERNLISGSVLIAHGDSVLLEKGYGLANREHDVTNTGKTVFELASITKALTALSIFQLVEQERLRLDDTVDQFVPDYPSGDKITIGHLLTHTSGIRSYVFLPDFAEKERQPLSVEEIIAWFENEPLEFAPGDRFSYSNSGYALLTYVIERASGESYAEYLKDNVFGPAGMFSSGVDSFTRVVPGRATGYSRDGCTGEITRADFREPGFAPGVGSAYSTVGDLYRLDRALRERRLLSNETQALMTTAHVDTPWGDRYAYGWFVGESRGRKIVHHEGGTRGFMTTFRRFVDDDVVVVALFNQDLMIANEIFSRLDAIAFGETWEPLFPASSSNNAKQALAAYTGNYAMEPDGELAFTAESDRFYIQEPGCSRFEVWPMSATRGFATDANAVLDFSDREEGGKTRIRAQFGILRWEGERASTGD